MEHGENNGSDDKKDTLYVAGGLALVVFGAGLIMTHPTIRRSVSAVVSGLLPELQSRFGAGVSGLGPDIARYLKMKDM